MMMRRRERQVTDEDVIDGIIEECTCCRLGMIDEEGVYIVPMSFGYDAGEDKADKEQDESDIKKEEKDTARKGEGRRRTLFFHGSREGRKARCLEGSSSNDGEEGKGGVAVSFEMDTGYLLKRADMACGHSAYYKSIMGKGIMQCVEDEAEKRKALNLIMEHTAGKGDWEFPAAMLHHVAVWKLEVEEISCKVNMPK